MAREPQAGRDVLPAAALRDVREALDVDRRHAGRLVVGKAGWSVWSAGGSGRSPIASPTVGHADDVGRGGRKPRLAALEPDQDEALACLRDAVVGGDVEVAREPVVQPVELVDEVAAARLRELRDVLEEERARSQLADEPQEFEDERVAPVAEVRAALLLGEPLARRAGGQEVEPVAGLEAGECDHVRRAQRSDVGDERVVAEVARVRRHGRRVAVDRRVDGEARAPEAQAEASGAAEQVYARRPGAHRGRMLRSAPDALGRIHYRGGATTANRGAGGAGAPGPPANAVSCTSSSPQTRPAPVAPGRRSARRARARARRAARRTPPRGG